MYLYIYINHSQSWLVYGIVLPPLNPIKSPSNHIITSPLYITMQSPLHHYYKTPWNHHEITMKPPWNHHETTMKYHYYKTPWNHHEITMKPPWNITIHLVPIGVPRHRPPRDRRGSPLAMRRRTAPAPAAPGASRASTSRMRQDGIRGKNLWVDDGFLKVDHGWSIEKYLGIYGFI